MITRTRLKAIIKRVISAGLSLAVGVLLTFGASAHESIPITLDGVLTELESRLINSTTYVELDEADRALRSRSTDGETEVRAVSGEPYISARGRYIGGAENLTIDGKLFVPIRSLAKVYGISVGWLSENRSVELDSANAEPIASGESFYPVDQLYWLSRIISAESRGEPLAGKVLVGNVVMNRTKSNDFPNTIYGVIFDSKYGVQFTPTQNGTIFDEPTAESVIAAKLVLDGWSLSNTALYFLNPSIATSFWIVENRDFITSVGGHDFYS